MANASDVCIVGAGPAGLQWASILHATAVPYVVLEQTATAAAFMRMYPRGRRLISHNKCRVGEGRSDDFALRHDWHSILEANRSMCDFSREYYPHADEYVEYLSAVASVLWVRYDTRVLAVEYGNGEDARHVLRTSRGVWSCTHVVLATGLTPLPPPIEWAPDAMTPSARSFSYADFPALDEATGEAPFCSNQQVAVIGAGNSAFEVAEMLKSCASAVHLVSRVRRWALNPAGVRCPLSLPASPRSRCNRCSPEVLRS